MTFYGIYDGHRMSYDSIKVWQYGYRINRLDLTVADKYKIFSFHRGRTHKLKLVIIEIFPFVLPFIK